MAYKLTVRDAYGRRVKQEQGFIHHEYWMMTTGWYVDWIGLWRARVQWANLSQ
jgi:hypothetical protein